MTCRRPNCGGLLLTRATVTPEGELTEVYCSACSRIQDSRVTAPYQPYRVRFRADVEAALDREVSSSRPADRETDDTSGIGLPRETLDGLDVDRGSWG